MHKAKKSLGQNFLKSELALKKIIEAGEVRKDDVILEIGPGKGALTEKLLGHPISKLIAVEKDRELFEFLKTKFATQIQSGTFVLVNDDILEFNASAYSLKPSAYKIIANIPYNITGAILKKFLTAKNPSGVALRASQPERMVLMVQHEVASRILARDGKESILSISVKAYGEPKMVMKVNKRYFSPAPKVDSAIIEIKNISRKLFEENEINPVRGREGSQRPSASNGVNEEKFWEIVKNGFAHKRKKLSSNLKSIYGGNSSVLENLGNKRAEDLTLSDWISLAKQ